MNRTLEERFWVKVNKFGPVLIPRLGRCWVWTGHLQRGYGQIRKGRGKVRAHRCAWELTFGPITNKLWVLHKCDNPTCVRPSHLFIGTALDNSQDMLKKGRGNKATGNQHGTTLQPQSVARGVKNGASKLNDHKVLSMRVKWEEGESQEALAREFKVSSATVRKIVRRKTWTHVQGAEV